MYQKMRVISIKVTEYFNQIGGRANSGSLASEEGSISFCGKHNPEVNRETRDP